MERFLTKKEEFDWLSTLDFSQMRDQDAFSIQTQVAAIKKKNKCLELRVSELEEAMPEPTNILANAVAKTVRTLYLQAMPNIEKSLNVRGPVLSSKPSRIYGGSARQNDFYDSSPYKVDDIIFARKNCSLGAPLPLQVYNILGPSEKDRKLRIQFHIHPEFRFVATLLAPHANPGASRTADGDPGGSLIRTSEQKAISPGGLQCNICGLVCGSYTHNSQGVITSSLTTNKLVFDGLSEDHLNMRNPRDLDGTYFSSARARFGELASGTSQLICRHCDCDRTHQTGGAFGTNGWSRESRKGKGRPKKRKQDDIPKPDSESEDEERASAIQASIRASHAELNGEDIDLGSDYGYFYKPQPGAESGSD